MVGNPSGEVWGLLPETWTPSAATHHQKTAPQLGSEDQDYTRHSHLFYCHILSGETNMDSTSPPTKKLCKATEITQCAQLI